MQLDWCDPLEFAARYAGYDPLVFLHSSLPHPQHGQLSILAINQQEEVTGSWKDLAKALLAQTDATPWQERWFGFLAYELGHPADLAAATIPLPDLWFGRFATVFVFNHAEQTLHRYGEEVEECPAPLEAAVPAITSLGSNMDKARYLDTVEQTLQQIAAGEFYQANITRKFFGEFAQAPEAFALFKVLCEASPGSYGAYLRRQGRHILSSSPECFLTIDDQGKVESRPIKGTAPRDSDPQELANSQKDRAENLMIVDLMRNDLSYHCEAGSVETHKLFEVTSYATLHHMASTVTGQRADGHSGLDLIRGCFPPGSMTGAPKKAVMEWCEKMEQQKRGIYSGALGWLAADGSADLSVVIRTLLIHGTQFEFQMGGGIVADSKPESEWQETLTKAKGVSHCLKLTRAELEKL